MAGKAGVAIYPQDRMSRRSDPRQERSRARQRALLDAAEEILGEVGADGLKMREVARRANLPIASLYHYFPSKEEFFKAALAEAAAELAERTAPDESLPALEQVRGSTRAFAGWIGERGPAYMKLVQ